MSRFVLDCSVTMAWCFADEADQYAEEVLGALEGGFAIVPAVWAYEVSNVLLVAERRRRLQRADTVRFLALLSALPIEVEAAAGVAGITALVTLGRERRLSAYDAAYLDLALREQLPLATRDGALRSAARAADVRHFAP